MPVDNFYFVSKFLAFLNLGTRTRYQNSQIQKGKEHTVVLYLLQRAPNICHLTWAAQIPDRDVVCGRNAWTTVDNETCHQDQHHWASLKTPVLLGQFFAWKQKNVIMKQNSNIFKNLNIHLCGYNYPGMRSILSLLNVPQQKKPKSRQWLAVSDYTWGKFI